MGLRRGGRTVTMDTIGATASADVARWWGKAIDWWPKFLAAEKAWSDANGDGAPYPMEPESWAFQSPGGVDTFASKPSFLLMPIARPVVPIPEQARTLLDLLDAAPLVMSSDSVPDHLYKSYKELHELEVTSACKLGRGDSVLNLWTSAGPKPPSRIAFNPDLDIAVGDFVILKVEVNESSGQRGWDVGEVVSLGDGTIQVRAPNARNRSVVEPLPKSGNYFTVLCRLHS